MPLALVEMIFFFGVVLVLAIWQLWTVWDPTKKENESAKDPQTAEVDRKPEDLPMNQRQQATQESVLGIRNGNKQRTQGVLKRSNESDS